MPQETDSPPRRWGSASALSDDEEARRRLLAAAGRCIARRGDAKVSLTEVADEAAVTRSTVYRYFATRNDLLLELIVRRVDAWVAAAVASLPHPEDATHSLREIALRSLGRVESDTLNEALFSERSRALVNALQLESERVVDAYLVRLGPLLAGWQADGRLHPDLDHRETVRWMMAVSQMLLAPPWRARSTFEKGEALERYFLRALVRS